MVLLSGAASAASYTVQPGDTLWRVAKAFGTTPEALDRSNTLRGQPLNAGQTLTVPDTVTPYAALLGQPLGTTLESLNAGAPAPRPTAPTSKSAVPTSKSAAPISSASSPTTGAISAAQNAVVNASPFKPGTVTVSAPVIVERLNTPLPSLPTLAPAPAAPSAPVSVRPTAFVGPQQGQTPPAATWRKGQPLTAAARALQPTPGLRLASKPTLPPQAYLEGLGHSYQTMNNCGPAAVMSVMQYYDAGYKVDQNLLRRILRPDGGLTAVDPMSALLTLEGLRAPVLRGGSISEIRTFVAHGVPVIVLQYAQQVGKVPHFRVVSGYDDVRQQIWMSDSLIGPTTVMSYRDFDALWNTQGRIYLPVYPASRDITEFRTS